MQATPDVAELAAKRSGWQTAIDIVIAPGAAFAQMRAVPTWGWAFVISAGLAMIATAAIAPAVAHGLALDLPAQLLASPRVSQLPADERAKLVAQQVGIAQAFAHYTFLVIPFALAIGCAFQALIMLIGNAIGKGDGTFKRFWSLAVNTSVVGSGISALALMLIVLIRGADSFSSAQAVAAAVPGLGTFVPASAKGAAAFLGVMNVFAIWNWVLLASGLTIVARLARPAAIGTVVAIAIGTGILPLVGALLKR